MLHRRQILKSGVAAAAVAAVGTPLAWAETAASKADGAALNKLFDQFMKENLDMSPVGATFLGIDTGARAKQRGEIDDNSLAGYQKNKELISSQLQRLNAFDAKSLTGMDELNYEIVQYGLQIQDGDDKKYDYGGEGAGAPYIVSQLTGTYQQFPDFLASQQPVENKDDAEYYLQRLDGVGTALDRDSEVARHDVALGVIPPDFALDKALTQMAALRNVDAGKSV
ncbi:MAG: DUF885 family protein, partial [Proteobacteria bacterium]|nr:DUF885 family protein [Pseudomonadota bacterium]